MIKAHIHVNELKNILVNLNEFVKKMVRFKESKTEMCSVTILSLSPCKNMEINKNLQCEGYTLKFKEKTAPFQIPCICKKHEKIINEIFTHPFSSRIEQFWPLKKGALENKILAWEQLKTSYECNQVAFSFLIKIAFVLNCQEKEEANDLVFQGKSQALPAPNSAVSSEIENYFEHFMNLKNIFSNHLIQVFFWSEIKTIYSSYSYENSKNSRTHFVENILIHNCIVVLCLEDTIFRLRSGTNIELSAFENFILDLTRCRNGLIVFSTQSLILNKKQNDYFFNDYKVSFKKKEMEQELSVHQAMEPDFIISNDQRYVDANRSGCFDRLLELLAIGQNFIDKIEKDYIAWRTEIKRSV